MIATHTEHEQTAIEKTKQRKKLISKEYMRTYYHRHKAEVVCTYCQKSYACNSKLAKHQARSLICAYHQIKSICETIEDPIQKRNMEDSMERVNRMISKITTSTTE